MTAFTYTALRSLAPGHTLGVDYSIDFNARELSPKDDPKMTESVSISGRTQTTVEREEERFMLQSDQLLVGSIAYANLLEFLKSVNQGEPFTFDAYGSVLSPDNPQPAKLVKSFDRQRVGQSPEFIFSFQLRILP